MRRWRSCFTGTRSMAHAASGCPDQIAGKGGMEQDTARAVLLDVNSIVVEILAVTQPIKRE